MWETSRTICHSNCYTNTAFAAGLPEMNVSSPGLQYPDEPFPMVHEQRLHRATLVARCQDSQARPIRAEEHFACFVFVVAPQVVRFFQVLHRVSDCVQLWSATCRAQIRSSICLVEFVFQPFSNIVRTALMHNPAWHSCVTLSRQRPSTNIFCKR